MYHGLEIDLLKNRHEDSEVFFMERRLNTANIIMNNTDYM